MSVFRAAAVPASRARRTITTRLPRRRVRQQLPVRQQLRLRKAPQAPQDLRGRRDRHSRALPTANTMSAEPCLALVLVTTGNFNRGCSASKRIWLLRPSTEVRKPAAYPLISAEQSWIRSEPFA